MTRLNTYIRDQIVKNALIKSGYRKDRDAYSQRRFDWIELCRVKSLGITADALDILNGKIEKLRLQVPEHIRGTGSVMKVRSNMRLNAAGEREYLYFYDVPGGDQKSKVSAEELVLIQGDPLLLEREALKAEDARLEDQYERVRMAVKAAVKRPTTVKALLAAWPEAKELLPDTLEESKSQLPAVQVADLNLLVGLPSD